jgi:hypothetical protein
MTKTVPTPWSRYYPKNSHAGAVNVGIKMEIAATRPPSLAISPHVLGTGKYPETLFSAS